MDLWDSQITVFCFYLCITEFYVYYHICLWIIKILKIWMFHYFWGRLKEKLFSFYQVLLATTGIDTVHNMWLDDPIKPYCPWSCCFLVLIFCHCHSHQALPFCCHRWVHVLTEHSWENDWQRVSPKLLLYAWIKYWTKSLPLTTDTHSLDVMLNMLSDASSMGAASPSGHFMLINAAPPSADLLGKLTLAAVCVSCELSHSQRLSSSLLTPRTSLW